MTRLLVVRENHDILQRKNQSSIYLNKKESILKYLNSLVITFFLAVSSAFFVSCSEDDGDTSTEKNLEITEANIMGCWKFDEVLINGKKDGDFPETAYFDFKENGESILFEEEDQRFLSWSIDVENYFYIYGENYIITKLTRNTFHFYEIRERENQENSIREFKLSKSTNCPEEVESPNKVTADFSGLDIDYFDAQNVSFSDKSDIDYDVYVIDATFYIGNIHYNIYLSISEEYDKEIEFNTRGNGEELGSFYHIIDSEINYSEENGIITGTFSFTAEDEETGNIVTCTNGQFTIDKSTAENDGITGGDRKNNNKSQKINRNSFINNYNK
jgi:hypothetical protein